MAKKTKTVASSKAKRKPKKTYKWKDVAPGNPGRRANAQAVGETVERLAKKYGGITPGLVVEHATNSSSPLHKCFEWDDDEAARKYREQQARHVLQCLIYLQPRSGGRQPLEIRAFVSVESTQHSPGRYLHVTIAMREGSTTRQETLNRAWLELKQWQSRYERFVEFASIMDAIKGYKKPPKRRKRVRA